MCVICFEELSTPLALIQQDVKHLIFDILDPRLLCTAFSLREYYLFFKRTGSNRSSPHTYRRMHRKWNRFQMGFKRGMKAGRHLLVLANQIKLRCANNFFLFVVVTEMSIAVVHGRDSSVVTSLTSQTIMSEPALAGALATLELSTAPQTQLEAQ
ncbi:uncharacterized protein HD556DRAFT_1306608 [Suillus plorans]|uniref:Uncharacterized protein n=1 Tax=Suillus plorans TaxID=116603 RepID=A0A9P7DL36_9AGAM|nr:uncharacterized protein HD556DRAFT_1306608 [Suillus plorans]KAG1797476.1 hypothetical protein HD556DRAFT_1306608 [Suillus plorans]